MRLTQNTVDACRRLTLRGQVKDKEKRLDSSLIIDADERIIRGECACNFYQQNKLYRGRASTCWRCGCNIAAAWRARLRSRNTFVSLKQILQFRGRSRRLFLQPGGGSPSMQHGWVCITGPLFTVRVWGLVSKLRCGFRITNVRHQARPARVETAQSSEVFKSALLLPP